MITRIWHGWTRPEQADEYEHLLLEHVFPEIAARALSGRPGHERLRRGRSQAPGFVSLLQFDDPAAVHVSDSFDTPPEARTLLAHFDSLSSHYRTVAVRAGGRTS